MNKLHPQIWELLAKSYRHAHGEDSYLSNLLQALPLSIDFKGLDPTKRNIDEQFRNFLSTLSLEDGLKVIRDALEDNAIENLKMTIGTTRGLVKFWRGRIITCLETCGIRYDEKTKVFYTLKDCLLF